MSPTKLKNRQKNVYITVHKRQLNELVHESCRGTSTKHYNNRGVHFFKSSKLHRLMNNITTNSDYKDTFTAWMSVIPGLCSLQQNFRAEIKTSVNNLYVPVLISCLHNVEEDLRMHRLARQQDTVINNDCVKETSSIKNHTELTFLSTRYCLFESGYVYSTPHSVHIWDSRKKVTPIFLIHCHIQKIGTNTLKEAWIKTLGLASAWWKYIPS